MKEDGSKIIRLVNGNEVRVSAARYPYLSEYRWYQFPNRFVYRREAGRAVMMHREIMGATSKDVVLHLDGDRLNCTDQNLVVRKKSAVISERMRERPKGGTSPYRGVSWHKRSKRWQVVIRAEGKLHYIGSWEGTPEGELQAAKAYDVAALRLHGKRARLNFPKQRRRRAVKADTPRMRTSVRTARPARSVVTAAAAPAAPAAEAPRPQAPPAAVAQLYEKPVHELTPEEMEKMKAQFLGNRYRPGSGGRRVHAAG